MPCQHERVVYLSEVERMIIRVCEASIARQTHVTLTVLSFTGLAIVDQHSATSVLLVETFA
jgi:hypothetical protein